MQKIEVVVRITKDHCPPQEQTIFEWFDLMRNPTDALSRPDLEINLEHHRVFKRGTEVYMSRYEYGVRYGFIVFCAVRNRHPCIDDQEYSKIEMT